ncbi:hypothetical protein ACQKKX_11600 [Neorhizobium sp. NPDC001467]|uniref:hypothetical protein n=1 Tax=Neorhizobium sp. NPDC001467 TaxID=3390595 RepID=UPI003D029B61
MSAFRSRHDGRSHQRNTTADYDILPPAPSRRSQAQDRPGFGGAAWGRHAAGRPTQAEAVDAHFVTVRDTRSRHPAETAPRNDNRRAPRRPAVNRPAPHTGLLARTLDRCEQALMRLSADFFSAIVALVFVLVFGASGGFSLIAGGPADAASVSALGLTHVNLTPQDANGMPVMLITGMIENSEADVRSLSPIRAELLLDGRVVAQTMIAPPAATIGPKQSRGFSAKMAYAGGKKPELRLSMIDNGASGS